MGSFREQLGLTTVLLQNLPFSSLCRAVSSTPFPIFTTLIGGQKSGFKDLGQLEGSVPRSICFLSSLTNSVCTHSSRRQNLSLFPPAGDSDASSDADVLSSGSVIPGSRLVAVNSALNLAYFSRLVPVSKGMA